MGQNEENQTRVDTCQNAANLGVTKLDIVRADRLTIEVQSFRKRRSKNLLHPCAQAIGGIEFEFDSLLYFAADPTVTRNVLGSHGWLDRIVLGIVD